MEQRGVEQWYEYHEALLNQGREGTAACPPFGWAKNQNQEAHMSVMGILQIVEAMQTQTDQTYRCSVVTFEPEKRKSKHHDTDHH